MQLVERKAGRIFEDKRESAKRATDENNGERIRWGGVQWKKARKRKGGRGSRKVGRFPGGPISWDSHYLPPWIPATTPTPQILFTIYVILSFLILTSLSFPLHSHSLELCFLSWLPSFYNCSNYMCPISHWMVMAGMCLASITHQKIFAAEVFFGIHPAALLNCSTCRVQITTDWVNLKYFKAHCTLLYTKANIKPRDIFITSRGNNLS